MSLGYTNDNGIVKTSNFQRFTASVNLAPSFFDDHLKFNINAKYMNGKNRYADTGAAIGGALAIDPTRPVYSTDDPYQFTGGYWQNINSTSGFSDPNWKYTPIRILPRIRWLHWSLKMTRQTVTTLLEMWMLTINSISCPTSVCMQA